MKLIYVLLLLLVSCSSAVSGQWKATQDIVAYDSVNGKPFFTIKKGQICAKGEYSYGKVDRFAEVKCEGTSAWVVDDHFLIEVGKQENI